MIEITKQKIGWIAEHVKEGIITATPDGRVFFNDDEGGWCDVCENEVNTKIRKIDNFYVCASCFFTATDFVK